MIRKIFLENGTTYDDIVFVVIVISANNKIMNGMGSKSKRGGSSQLHRRRLFVLSAIGIRILQQLLINIKHVSSLFYYEKHKFASCKAVFFYF